MTAEPIVKFPRTPHLAWRGAEIPRDDKLLAQDEATRFFTEPVVMEEKIDGANIGLAIDNSGDILAWNRGTVLGPGGHPQFQPFWPWLAERKHMLHPVLARNLVFFGEWCFARHSVPYTRLPDWFLLFDVYDLIRGEFWCTPRRDDLAQQLSLSVVPPFCRKTFASVEDVITHIGRSNFADTPAEGGYLRIETEQKLLARAKLVRPEFTNQIDQHWSTRKLVKNSLAKPRKTTVSLCR